MSEPVTVDRLAVDKRLRKALPGLRQEAPLKGLMAAYGPTASFGEACNSFADDIEAALASPSDMGYAEGIEDAYQAIKKRWKRWEAWANEYQEGSGYFYHTAAKIILQDVRALTPSEPSAVQVEPKSPLRDAEL